MVGPAREREAVRFAQRKLGVSQRRACKALEVSRSTIRYKPELGEFTRRLLARILELVAKHPRYGYKRIWKLLRRDGWKINRKRVQRLMRIMGLEAIYPRPRTSRPHPEHKVYPYLLRNAAIDRPDQVWTADITYIPMSRGFMYLVAVMDWHSRKVLSFKVSNTLGC